MIEFLDFEEVLFFPDWVMAIWQDLVQRLKATGWRGLLALVMRGCNGTVSRTTKGFT